MFPGRVRVLPLIVCLVSGCATVRMTDPGRTATEQLLLSTAAERAVQQLDLASLSGRKVFVDATNFEGADKAYALGSLSSRAADKGALLVAKVEEAAVIAAARAGALSIDRAEFLIGIPRLVLPTPMGATVQTPEVALVKRVAQTGIAKVALTAYETGSGKPVLSAGPVSGTSYYTLWTLLGFSWRLTDLPEKAPRFRWWPWGT